MTKSGLPTAQLSQNKQRGIRARVEFFLRRLIVGQNPDAVQIGRIVTVFGQGVSSESALQRRVVEKSRFVAVEHELDTFIAEPANAVEKYQVFAVGCQASLGCFR